MTYLKRKFNIMNVYTYSYGIFRISEKIKFRAIWSGTIDKNYKSGLMRTTLLLQ
jgi:hypothetical protein